MFSQWQTDESKRYFLGMAALYDGATQPWLAYSQRIERSLSRRLRVALMCRIGRGYFARIFSLENFAEN
jgi:hypothetical protein